MLGYGYKKWQLSYSIIRCKLTVMNDLFKHMLIYKETVHTCYTFLFSYNEYIILEHIP